MDNTINKNKVITSLLWKFLERISAQGIQFVVIIVLARLLLPEEFGLIVIVSIFISIAGVIVQSGFNTALIQKKHVDEIDYSSVFFLHLLLSTLLYLFMYLLAPFLAIFFEQPQLTLILRVLSIVLIIDAFNSIQYAIISRNLQFKKLFKSTVIAVIISGIVGIVLALWNFGIWSLVAQQLTNQVVITILLFVSVNWRPKLLFSFKRINSLFSFGWKLLVSALLDTAYNNLRNVVVGKLFSPTALGFYNRGEQFPILIISNINSSIQSVLFPALAAQQDNRQRVKEMVRRSIITSSYIIFPMMMGLAIVAEPLILTLLTEKWLPAAPFLQIFCAVYAFWPIHTANLQAINALGRSDIFLKLEVVKKVIGVIILVFSMQFGVHAIALGLVVGGIISTILNIYPNIKLLDYGMKEQLKDVAPSFLVSLMMGTVVFSVVYLHLTPLFTLIIQIILGMVMYIILSIIFKLESFLFIIKALKDLKNSKRNEVGKGVY